MCDSVWLRAAQSQRFVALYRVGRGPVPERALKLRGGDADEGTSSVPDRATGRVYVLWSDGNRILYKSDATGTGWDPHAAPAAIPNAAEQRGCGGVRPWTLRGYKTVVRDHLLPRIGARRLQSLSGSEIKAPYGELRESVFARNPTPERLQHLRQVAARYQELRRGPNPRSAVCILVQETGHPEVTVTVLAPSVGVADKLQLLADSGWNGCTTRKQAIEPARSYSCSTKMGWCALAATLGWQRTRAWIAGDHRPIFGIPVQVRELREPVEPAPPAAALRPRVAHELPAAGRTAEVRKGYMPAVLRGTDAEDLAHAHLDLGDIRIRATPSRMVIGEGRSRRGHGGIIANGCSNGHEADDGPPVKRPTITHCAVDRQSDSKARSASRPFRVSYARRPRTAVWVRAIFRASSKPRR
jgi:hypothetical protein